MRKDPSPPKARGGRKRAGNGTGSNVLEPAPEGLAAAAVKFSVVEIREFERVVGDNPSCSSGMYCIKISTAHSRVGGEAFTAALYFYTVHG